MKRGNILTPGSNMRWESSRMMLPEHRKALLARKKEQMKVKKLEQRLFHKYVIRV